MKKIFILSFAILLSACSSTNEQVNSSTIETNEVVESHADVVNNGSAISLDSLHDVTFYAKSVNGEPVNSNWKNVSIVFLYHDKFGNIVRGNTGCNRYFAKYETIRSVLITKEIVSTNKRCLNNSVANIERFVFNIYAKNPVILVSESQIILETANDKIIFEK